MPIASRFYLDGALLAYASVRRAVLFRVSIVLLCLPRIVLAADEPPAPATRVAPSTATSLVTAPKPLVTADVPYPFDGSGDADVVLTLLISDAGNVREIRNATGPEPFVSQARASVASWTYEPAQRGAAKVAAVIRVLVHFEAPKPKPRGRSLPDGPAADATGAGAKPETATEVLVRGNRAPAPNTMQLGKSEVRQLPGAFGDPFRAIDVLPGVVPTISGLPFYYIRGAPPSNVGYYLDGVRVPYLFHFGLGPSVVHPALVERVVLYPGAPPENFGRFAGAYITADGAAPRKFAEANLRLVDFGAIAETSVLNDRLYVLAGGRFSYTAALLSLFAPDITLDYRDYQARVTYKLTPHDDIRAFFFGGSDFVVQDQEEDRAGEKSQVRNVFFASEFHRGDLRYRPIQTQPTSKQASLRATTERASRVGATRETTCLPVARGSVMYSTSTSRSARVLMSRRTPTTRTCQVNTRPRRKSMRRTRASSNLASIQTLLSLAVFPGGP